MRLTFANSKIYGQYKHKIKNIQPPDKINLKHNAASIKVSQCVKVVPYETIMHGSP